MQNSNDVLVLSPPALEDSEITPTQWQNLDLPVTTDTPVKILSTPDSTPNIFIDISGKQQDETIYTRVCISPELPPLPAIEDFKRHFLVVNDALNVLFDIAKNHFEALLDFEKQQTSFEWCQQHQSLMRCFLAHEKERELFAISLKRANDAGITYFLLVEGLTTYRLLFKIETRTTTYY